MQNSYRLLTTKILQRQCPKETSKPCRIILAFSSSHSTKALPDPNKCNDQRDFDQNDPINGKVAIITGGAQGIGFDVAQTLLRNGVKGVTLADNDCTSGEKSCSCLCEEFGEGCAMFCHCDVMKSENMDCVFLKTLNHFKRIDLVVNNAGIMDDKNWESEITVNIGGCVIGSLLGLQYMSKSCQGRGGVVVNLANIASVQPLSGCPIYTMTQSAIVGFTRALGSGCQYLRTGVKVLGLCAGPTDTRLMQKLETRAINAHFAKELLQELEGRQLQSTSFVSQGLLKILSKGDSGSIWVAHNCKEAFQICFAPCAEDMKLANQDEPPIKSEIKNAECVQSVSAEDKQAENFTMKSGDTIQKESKILKDQKDEETSNKLNKNMVSKNINKECNDQQFLCDQKAGNCSKRPDSESCGVINLCEVKQKFLPELSTSEVQIAACLTQYELFPFWDSRNAETPYNSESKPASGAQVICPDSSKSKVADSISDSILKSSFSKTLASVFTSKKKSSVKSEDKVQDDCKKTPPESVKNSEKEKLKDPCDNLCEKQEVDCAPTSEKSNLDEKDVCKTLELCDELKNILSETCKQSKMSPKEENKEQTLNETQNTQLNYPQPPPKHPPTQQSLKLEIKTKESEKGCGIGPKILNPNSCRKSKECEEPTCTGDSNDLCAEIKSNKIRFDDICSKLKSNNSKKDPCATTKANSSGCKNQKNICKDETSSQKSGRKERCVKQNQEMCTNIKQQKETRTEVCKTVKPSKAHLKNCTKDVECKEPKTGIEKVTNEEAKQRKGKNFDLRTGSCIEEKREIDETPLKINYDGKPIPPFLPPQLSRSTTNEWKACKKAKVKPDSSENSKEIEQPFYSFILESPKYKKTKNDGETDKNESDTRKKKSK